MEIVSDSTLKSVTRACIRAYVSRLVLLYHARWHFAANRAEILQNDAAIVETVQRHLGQNAVSRGAFNCDEIYVDQIADANITTKIYCRAKRRDPVPRV